jgi:hypothetical protein
LGFPVFALADDERPPRLVTSGSTQDGVDEVTIGHGHPSGGCWSYVHTQIRRGNQYEPDGIIRQPALEAFAADTLFDLFLFGQTGRSDPNAHARTGRPCSWYGDWRKTCPAPTGGGPARCTSAANGSPCGCTRADGFAAVADLGPSLLGIPPAYRATLPGNREASMAWPDPRGKPNLMSGQPQNHQNRRPSRAIFVFDEMNDLTVFPSTEQAVNGGMESYDVDDGIYTIFDHRGHVVTARTENLQIFLEVTDEERCEEFLDRLNRSLDTSDNPIRAEDALTLAERLLWQEWERRWPRRPRWLHRLLHNDSPAYP